MREAFVERLLRGLYSAALYVLVPVTVYHLIWRGFRQVEYFQRWGERYASYSDEPHRATLWIHAVSVGEVNAAAPLVDALLEQRPGMRLLVTTITPTGSARVSRLWGNRVEHVYLPYDLSGAVHRFLDHFQPQLGLIVETELWPNLLFCCRDYDVPVYIVNARLSARSLRGYRLLRPLVSRALRTARVVAAQSAEDGRRFRRLGAREDQVVVTGNLKYDIAADPGLDGFARQFRERCGDRPAWIAASTHVDEEAAVLAIHARLRKRRPDLLLLGHCELIKNETVDAIRADNPSLRIAYRNVDPLPDPPNLVYSVNEAYAPHWSEGQRAFIDELKDEGYTQRYIGSLVADFHRTLLRGGIFLYPPDARQPQGKLRLLYEAAPLAFIAEQAGGRASNGHEDIMDVQPTELHQRTPLYMGSKAMVDRAVEYAARDSQVP